MSLLGKQRSYCSNNDIIDRNVNKFHEEADESHDQKANTSGSCDTEEF